MSLARAIEGLVRARILRDPETEEITPEVRRRASGAFVALPRGVTHVEVAGDAGARTVVLVHGLSVPLHLWDTLFPPLAEAGLRVIRYDLYGRGLSDRPDARYGEDLYDEQLAGLLDALGATGPVDLVGLSMATSIVATFAHRRPARVRSIALFGPGFGTGRPAPRRLATPVLGELVMATRVAPTLAEGQRGDLLHPERFPDWPARYREQMRYRGFRRALLSTLRHYMGRDMERDFRRIGEGGRPVLLVWGEADNRVSAAEMARIRALLPRAAAHVVPEAGHLPHLERPEIVGPLLISFLREAAR